MDHAADASAGSNRSMVEAVQEFSVPLLAGVVVALLWANIDPDSYSQLVWWSPLGTASDLNLHFLVNDAFMVLFFGIAAKEITEACLPGGVLNPPRKAVNPLFATLGGVVGPIAIYLLVASLSGKDDISRGWGIPTATDIALAWLVARLVFGRAHPAVSFLLLLAVADDAIGLGSIAIFYSDPASPVRPAYLVMVAGAVGLSYAMKRLHLTSFWPYLLGPGVLSWWGLHAAHLHPALALVPVVPFMPSLGMDQGLFIHPQGAPAGDTLNRFEHFFRTPVDFGLFGFGLANAGVPLASIGPATWAVLVALLVGKTAGITLFSLAATRLGFPLPSGMNGRSLLVVAMTAALGLTVALFVAGVAFVDPVVQGAAKMGALLSSFVAVLVWATARILRVKGEPSGPERAPAAPDELGAMPAGAQSQSTRGMTAAARL